MARLQTKILLVLSLTGLATTIGFGAFLINSKTIEASYGVNENLKPVAYIEGSNVQYSSIEKALERVIYYVNKEGIEEIALGLPLNMNGTESEHSMMSRKFKEMIEKALPKCKVALIDERLSTVEATNYLLQADLSRKKRKKVIDKMAAVVILDTYLMSRR